MNELQWSVEHKYQVFTAKRTDVETKFEYTLPVFELKRTEEWSLVHMYVEISEVQLSCCIMTSELLKGFYVTPTLGVGQK